jgi:hypothetical protein
VAIRTYLSENAISPLVPRLRPQHRDQQLLSDLVTKIGFAGNKAVTIASDCFSSIDEA